MKFSILLLALFLNCVNLEELNKVQPINYLYSVVIANLRSSISSSTTTSNEATFQIQGTLKDSSGNPIANATLTLGVSQNLVSREAVTTSTTTDVNGNYTLNLRVGNFSVKVTNSSGVEIGAFRLNATSTTEKPSIAVTSGNMSLVVSAVTSPSPISPITPSTPTSTVAPSNLSYPSGFLNLTVGTAMTSLTPTVTGTVTSYSSNPAFPSGLTLNRSTGEISGTPTINQSATTYIITAFNTMGIASYNLQITVNPVAPSNLSYSSNNFTFYTGFSINNLAPNVDGVVVSYSVEPTLPIGLTINPNSGIISGTPLKSQLTQSYKVIGRNPTGSSEFIFNLIVNIPKYISMPNEILKTGQTISYINGDDGFYQKGTQKIFLPNGSTGIQWQRCSAGQNNDDNCSGVADQLNYQGARTYCESLTIDGKSWRLPSIFEISNLFDYTSSNNVKINNLIFPNTYPQPNVFNTYSGYWTDNGWFDFTSGLKTDNIYGFGYYRCVTGNEIKSKFKINDSETISELSHKLLWQKCSAGQNNVDGCSTSALTLNWESAINYCNSLNLNGKKWRLPNNRELITIIPLDYSFFSNPNVPDFFWSSTTASDTSRAFVVINNGLGGQATWEKTDKFLTKCVTDY